MFKIKIIVGGIAIAAVCLALVSFLLPAPEGVPSSQSTRTGSATVVGLSTLSVGAAALFLIGLGYFKIEVKRAYYLICAGLLGIGLSYLAIPMSLYFQNWFSDLNTYATQLPLLVGAICMYVGLYKFAQLVRLKTLFTPLITLIVAGLIAGILIVVRQNPVFAPSELAFDSAHIIIFFDVIASYLLWRTWQVVSPTYRKALFWLGLALGFKILAATGFVIVDYLPVPESFDVTSLGVLYIAQTLLFIRAGYVFNKITRVTAKDKERKEASPVEGIIYLVSLASNLREVDPLLEPMREVTANLSPNSQPSAQQQQRLFAVSHQVQNYLVHKEPLRSFTYETLQQLVAARYELPSAFFVGSAKRSAADANTANPRTGQEAPAK